MRLIDADALMEKLGMARECKDCPSCKDVICCKQSSQMVDVCEAIDEMPTIDAVPVVRCKDCKWWGLSEYNTFDIHICKMFSGVREYDFCSRAERSEE